MVRENKIYLDLNTVKNDDTVSGLYNELANAESVVHIIAYNGATFAAGVEKVNSNYVLTLGTKKVIVDSSDKITIEDAGGGSAGVTDVTVNGTSVVSDGVAAITMPTVGDLILKESTFDDSDFAIVTITEQITASISQARYSVTTITINDTEYKVVTQGTDTSNNITLEEGERFIMEKADDLTFECIESEKYLMRLVLTAQGEVNSLNITSGVYVQSKTSFRLFEDKTLDKTKISVKFYKYE